MGCPHRFATIKNGDKVLDIGSGLGIDSYIAGNRCGEDGEVIGIDIAKQQVN